VRAALRNGSEWLFSPFQFKWDFPNFFVIRRLNLHMCYGVECVRQIPQYTPAIFQLDPSEKPEHYCTLKHLFPPESQNCRDRWSELTIAPLSAISAEWDQRIYPEPKGSMRKTKVNLEIDGNLENRERFCVFIIEKLRASYPKLRILNNSRRGQIFYLIT